MVFCLFVFASAHLYFQLEVVTFQVLNSHVMLHIVKCILKTWSSSPPRLYDPGCYGKEGCFVSWCRMWKPRGPQHGASG